jgi:hypothetical protein
MKKIIFMAAALVALASCKKESEEVKVDETKMETPGDTITGKDTVAVIEAAPVQNASEAAEAQKEKISVQTELNAPKENFALFGEKFAADKALSSADMLKKYKTMRAGDTVVVKFRSNVNEVCKKKGCWMSMKLPGQKESFVRFKDYGFFVPKNADGSEAIVHGKAYLDVVSVAQLQHYAKDGGKSDEEIAKITEPKVTYAFQADGVLMVE